MTMLREIVLQDIDKKLLNHIQAEFPLTRDPFSDLGLKLGVSGDEIIDRLERLKSGSIIRRIGPVCDAQRLGYQTTLVAMKIPEAHLERAAQIISEHPGVSHNYERSHDFNLWFTLATPSSVDLQRELARLGDLVGAEAAIELPVLQMFKLRVFFDVAGDGSSATDSRIGDGDAHREDTILSPAERAVINELQQQDLPLNHRPFDSMAARLGMDVEDFLTHCRALLRQGFMRRFSALIRHTRVGFVANSMTCWIVPADKVEVAGQKLAALPEVSHCYERRTSPQWPYNLFAMIHGRSIEDCQAIAERVSQEVGLSAPVMLLRRREFKKRSVKYLV